jgi:hypothetical protein
MKIDRQQRLWKEQEAHVLGVQTAEQKTQEAQAVLEALTELLKREVQKGTKPGWQVRGNLSTMYPPFLEKEAPTYEDSVRLYVPPSLNPFLDMFTPGLKKDRERAKALAQQHYQQVRSEYDQERSRRLNIYQMRKQAYEQGDVRAITFVLKEILRNLHFPCGYGTVFEIDFDMDAEEAIIEMRLPHVSEMPTITRYRYIRQQKKLGETRLTANQIRDRYQDLLAQLTLATLFRLFHDATTPYLQSIVFNGYVSGVHPLRGGSIIIQAKRYQDLVPNAHVRELIGVMDIERATRGYLVTTGRFSKAAYDLAKEHNVQLFDGQNLLHQLHQYGFTDLTLQKE